MAELPKTETDLCDIVRQSSCVIPFGANSKRALSACDSKTTTRIDMRFLSGIVSYEPTEFLITAKSGTTVDEIERALAAKGQFLPFDPVWRERGSTIGGAVASGLSGPSRILYGSLRDFMLEIAMIDGLGKIVRGGGKVVKNAAGFDFPKLMVGSYGRLGILTEVTLKVFPKPLANLTLSWTCMDLASAIRHMLALVGQPLQFAALDIDPPCTLVGRLAGPPEALAAMADRAETIVGSQAQRIEHSEAERAMWQQRADMNWMPDGTSLVRVAVTAHQVDALAVALKTLDGVKAVRFSCAGAIAWLAVDLGSPLKALNDALVQCGLSGVAVSGEVAELTSLGDCRWQTFAARIQRAIDPEGKFVRFSQNSPKEKQS